MNPLIPRHKVVMSHTPQLYLRVKYWLRFFVYHVFTPLHSSTNQELFEKYVCNQNSYYEKYDTVDGAACPMHLLSEAEISIQCPSLSAMFDSLHSSTNQELPEKHLCNKSSHDEKYGLFLITQRKASRATTELMLFTVSKDEWNTNEDTSKSLKNTLHILHYDKRHLLGWSNVEQWKNQELLSSYVGLKSSGS